MSDGRRGTHLNPYVNDSSSLDEFHEMHDYLVQFLNISLTHFYTNWGENVKKWGKNGENWENISYDLKLSMALSGTVFAEQKTFQRY